MMAVELDIRKALELWRTTFVEGVRMAGPDLTARQLALLLTVYLAPPPHTVRGLAATLHVSKPAITRALDRLSQLGLLRRQRDETDRRNVFVERTAKGTAYLNDLGGRIAAAARVL
ncbi:MAG TPA: MarR family transcriptional regulator [Alphaproteobacteria bacterium]